MAPKRKPASHRFYHSSGFRNSLKRAVNYETVNQDLVICHMVVKTRIAGSAAATGPTVKALPESALSDRWVDSCLELVLLKYATKLNEGNNGVILQAHPSQIPARLWRTLARAGSPLSDSGPLVIKFQRRFRQGAGQAEFERQKNAYHIIRSAGQPQSYALVPEPYFHRDLVIKREETLARLHQFGLLSHRDTVAIIAMQFIPGIDLATLFFRWILDQAPVDKEYLRTGVNRDDFQDLHRAAAELLGFAKPGGKGATAEDRDFERRAVEFDNAAKVFGFLRRRGFHLNARLIEQMLATLHLFHSQNLYHQDAHARNFMVTGLEKVQPQAWLIDFEAGEHRLRESPEIQGEADLAFPRSMEQFGIAPDQRVIEETRRQIDEFRDLANRLSADARWRAEYAKTVVRLGQNPQREMENRFRVACVESPEKFIVLVKMLVDQGHLDRKVASQFMKEKAGETGVPMHLRNLLRLLRQALSEEAKSE
jgi:lipopolysaccharide kinase (Kdo/WaaP) family protein